VDQPFAAFLDDHFPGTAYTGLRRSARRFAEGFDLADLATVSTKALHAEWASEEDSSEYRVDGGYGQLVDFLVRDCGRLGVVFHFATPVSEIRWQKGSVDVMTAGGGRFKAERVIVTVSLAMLPAIGYFPSIPEYMNAARGIGYGSVIKILLEFKTAFWLKDGSKDQTLFILSEQAVPTWWTQPDASSALLTGWLNGENMRRFQALDEQGRIASCLSSLAAIFSLDIRDIQDQLAAYRIFDWAEQPYVHGGYSFDTVMTPSYRKVLRTPVGETLYFAGEAIYEGNAPGTVEAAFQTGLEAAEKIIALHYTY
jgi:monoamine oxidase